jgi:hypothetical protein
MRTGARALILLAGTALAVACAQPAAPTPEERAALAASEAVSPLRGDTSSYRIIYHPAVDLAKRPAS